MGNRTHPFRFLTERRLTQLTGLRARNLAELLQHLRTVGGASIFYHTHHRFLSHHFEKPLVHNDFAIWTGESLREPALSERLAALDLRSFTSVRQIRSAIISAVENHAASPSARNAECPATEEFFFCKSKSFVMHTGLVADHPADFFRKLPRVSNAGVYYHFVEARLRLERLTNDFSAWLARHELVELANEVDALDPYALTLDELREAIVAAGRKAGLA